MMNATRIGGYVVRGHSGAIHVQLPCSRVAVIDGEGNYRAFHNRVYAVLNVGIDAAEGALRDFLSERGVR